MAKMLIFESSTTEETMTRTEMLEKIADNSDKFAFDPAFKKAAADMVWCHHNGDEIGEAEATERMHKELCRIFKEI
jgi:hypothetical protein